MMMNAELGGLDPTHLSALMLKPTQPGRAWFTGKLVRSYGPSITRLEFQATYLLRGPSEEITTEMWAEFGLSSFRQLESLRLHWGDLYEYPANGALSEAYRTFLSLIPTPTQLRELCIVVWNQNKEGKTLPWTAPHLSSVITCAVDKFQDLQEITIEVSSRRFSVSLEKIIKAVYDALPERIVKNGLLRFRLGSQ
ncbi:hypothetical protein BD413DRAFT_259599 [Trametes elegans]|nr:hypothetical protein BD413DRAFT_259599 [Trametes elegans]